MPKQKIDFEDPRHAYAQPPYKNQEAIEMPGTTAEMDPQPDHGEESYVGHGLLKGRVALVTGADSGIGRAVAIAYAREGAKVVINYLSENEDALATLKLLEDAGVEAIKINADLRSESACQSLVEKTVDRFGRIDIVVNNAAYQETRESIDEMSSELFDRIFKTNVYAPFWLTKAAMTHMQPGTSVINTVSIQAFDPSAMLLPYASTKSALTGMTKAMAKLMIDKGIRVNAVAPGPVWTPLIPGSMPKDKFQTFGESTAFERPAQPCELSPLYVWLASAQASYITGEVYGATGGMSPM